MPLATPTIRIRRRPRELAFYDVFRDGITQSALAIFQTCQRKAYLSTHQGLFRESDSDSFSFGTAFHALNDLLFTHWNLNEEVLTASELTAFWDAISGEERIIDEASHHKREELLCQIEATLGAYIHHWAGDFKDKDWVGLEVTFDLPWVSALGEVRLRGKIDGLCRLKSDGSLQLKETKTRALVNEDSIVNKLPIDLQVNLYSEAVKRLFGELPKSVLYDVVRRPLLKLGKKESLEAYMQRIFNDATQERPDHYFFRYVSAIDADYHAAWIETQLTPLINSYVEWFSNVPKYPLMNTSACSVGPIVCPFLAMCGNGDDTGLIKKGGVHSELAPESIHERFIAWREKSGA